MSLNEVLDMDVEDFRHWLSEVCDYLKEREKQQRA
jgi:hypothetical protein